MRNSSRKMVNKSRSKREFKNKISRTKSPNLAPPPMRGGYRL